MVEDNLSAPLLKMARYFLVDTLPVVHDVRDVYAHARALAERGLVPSRGEERVLRQVVWSMLKIQNDQMEGALHQALTRLAALVLAVMEDDDLSIPDDRQLGGRLALEQLAVQLQMDFEQTELQIGAAMGTLDLSVRCGADVEAFAQRFTPGGADEQLERALRGAALHLRQGEELLARHVDPVRAERARARFDEACARTTHLLARLLAVPASRDPVVVRTNLVRRELKRIEVDALGVVRLSSEEQVQQAAKLLAWTAVELGETATDENRARLAAELQAAAVEPETGSAAESGDDWLFSMGE